MMNLIVVLFLIGVVAFLYTVWNEYLNDPKGDKELARRYLKTLEDYKKNRKG